uniref:DNA-directed RNA polymerase III subunit RPC5 C-terminal domain-containing protein n=1 Tax=Anabas testudineus TaxID=64144 RepID=A0A7N6ADR3_ANATE
MASGDDDDPIIEEIDVYLAKSLADKLYLFQYPVRPSTMTYDDVDHLVAKIKPKQQRVELEMAINTMSPNYCRSKGEQIALNVDGTAYDETNTYSVKMMDKQTFSSIQATTNTSRYAAAVFRKGELHITPLTGILQMRPSFSYLDKADNKTREREAANEGGDSSQDEAEDEAKAITVRFARPESEQARQRRIQSYEFLQKKQAEEPWVHLHYHGVKVGVHLLMRHIQCCLYCNCLSLCNYCHLASFFVSVKPVGPSNVLSMAQLRTLPLGEQVKTLMKNVKVMPFANLMGLLASGTDSTSVLRSIQQVALLVQGNWVVKSDVLYPKNTCSAHSGVPAEVLCRGRDFVMWRFTLERSVMRKEIASIIKLPPEDVKEFLEHVAAPRINRGWEFLLPTDVDFIKKHPDVAHRQHMLWLGIQSKLEKVFNLSKEDFMPKNTPQPEPIHVSGEQRLQVAQDRAKENQLSLQKDLDARRAGSSVQRPIATSEDEPMDTSSSLSSIPNGSVNGYPNATSPGFDYTNGGGPANIPSPELQDFVIKTFGKHFVLTLNELKRLLNLHVASMPVGQPVFHSISDHMLQDAVLLCHCKQIMVPVSIGGGHHGYHTSHRRLLYDMFTKNYRLRRNMIQAKLAEELGDVPKSDVDRLLNECCKSHAGMWYLKGTIQS